MRWYESGYTLSPECQDNGWGCDGCDCPCHGQHAPEFTSNAAVAEYHRDLH